MGWLLQRLHLLPQNHRRRKRMVIPLSNKLPSGCSSQQQQSPGVMNWAQSTKFQGTAREQSWKIQRVIKKKSLEAFLRVPQKWQEMFQWQQRGKGAFQQFTAQSSSCNLLSNKKPSALGLEANINREATFTITIIFVLYYDILQDKCSIIIAAYAFFNCFSGIKQNVPLKLKETLEQDWLCIHNWICWTTIILLYYFKKVSLLDSITNSPPNMLFPSSCSSGIFLAWILYLTFLVWLKFPWLYWSFFYKNQKWSPHCQVQYIFFYVNFHLFLILEEINLILQLKTSSHGASLS